MSGFEQLRDVREYLGLTIEDVAESLDRSPEHIEDVEAGTVVDDSAGRQMAELYRCRQRGDRVASKPRPREGLARLTSGLTERDALEIELFIAYLDLSVDPS